MDFADDWMCVSAYVLECAYAECSETIKLPEQHGILRHPHVKHSHCLLDLWKNCSSSVKGLQRCQSVVVHISV